MRKVWAVLVVALCALVGALAGGCGGDPVPAAAPRSEPTSIRQLHVSTMRVVRIDFCDLVPAKAVRRALATAPTKSASWRNGDRIPGGELGHEFGCSWRGRHAQEARAWVFARPVTAQFARTLTRLAATERGCRARPRTDFGSPGLVQTCTRTSSPLRIRRAGLFGDTWLSCEVSGRGRSAALRARTDAWCLSVANALNAA